MDSEKKASFKHADLVNELQIGVEENLESELDHKKCCIYRVPKLIRRVNKEAYTPQLVSIGPLHHGKQGLANMEKTKRRYKKSFFHKITTKKQEEILSFIEEEEKNIRSCYAETSELASLEYIKMILYDAIFIIELFLSNDHHLDTGDLRLSIRTVAYTLSSDLQLLENQLPFFVLANIYKLALDGSCGAFKELSQSFFDFRDLALTTTEVHIEHFTDWKRYTLLESYPKSSQANKGIMEDFPCAMKLHESGVKFKKIGEDKLLSFEKPKHKIPFFEVHELRLPLLRVDDATECVLRNIMALEQCHYPSDTHVCNFIRLIDNLIDNEKDVALLVENEIISHDIGDNTLVANMFNKLGICITYSQSSYYDICKKLKGHCNDPCTKKKATLQRVYFNNLWRGTATVAAVLLLLLTIVQTICSILQAVFM